MKNILKTSIISVATCAVLLSLQGCGKDRAGMSVSEAKSKGYISPSNISSTGRNLNCGTGTNDEDCDYLPDDEEGPGKRYPNAKRGVADQDGDHLVDGCEP